MTSSNGNIFRATGHLCGEFTGHRWILRTKASDAELWCFFFICGSINGWANNRGAGGLRRRRAQYDVNVMTCASLRHLLPASQWFVQMGICQISRKSDTVWFPWYLTDTPLHESQTQSPQNDNWIYNIGIPYKIRTWFCCVLFSCSYIMGCWWIGVVYLPIFCRVAPLAPVNRK